MKKSLINKYLLTDKFYEFINLTKEEFIRKNIDNLIGGIVYFASCVSEKYNDEINLGVQLNENNFTFITELTSDHSISFWDTLEDAERDFLESM